jgi:hypothetical protein
MDTAAAPPTSPRPSPAELYDATIRPVWRLARALHGDPGAAEDAVARAYAALSGRWPRDLPEGRLRLLVLLSEQAARRTGATPVA